MNQNRSSLEKFLRNSCGELGFCGISLLPLSPANLAGLRDRLEPSYASTSETFLAWPEYMRRTASKRADPARLVPWAKSIAMFAFPVDKIPANNHFLPETDDADTFGLVAGYAARADYHGFMRRKIIQFSDSLEKHLAKNFRTEIFVDTKPLAEKAIAAYSGLGAIGLNSCLLCRGQGSGTCLGAMAFDIELPATMPADFAAPCSTCGRCAEKCPTGAITGRPGGFIYNRCRSYLTMEKKDALGKNEKAMLGDWIFGCDICTSLCPGSHPLKPLKIDLEWLLLEDDNSAARLIDGTALEYPGLKLLRRNALAVLGNRKSRKAQSLIEKFASLEK